MKKGRRILVIGNWKMNPPLLSTAKRLFGDIKKKTARCEGANIVVAPPVVFLSEINLLWNKSKRVQLGAQNVYHEPVGPHTGEISLSMLKHMNVSHVIIGHSERRKDGETNELVNKKLAHVVKTGLTAILCVGEEKRDTHGNYLSYVEKQLREGLKGIPKGKLSNIVIAYEPIWAIGTGNTATPTDAHEMRLYIEKVLSDIYGRSYAGKVRILYGGSVHPNNAEALLVEGTIDGFLVGGASLKSDEFVSIVKTAHAYAHR